MARNALRGEHPGFPGDVEKRRPAGLTPRGTCPPTHRRRNPRKKAYEIFS
jgi:hypothetical protein